MKKLLFTLLFIPLLSIGQDKEIVELRNEITVIKENLDSHHKQFKSGVKISLLALPVTVIGILTSTPAIAIVGGITSLFGTIIMIDSDKWFGEKYMNKKHKAKSQGYITEERIQIFEGDKVEIITSFSTVNGTFINQEKGRISIKTIQGKEKIFILKNIKSISKIK
tara:strand:- start:92 stop:589 length:498 start_codon:yes stop_codon:yes gene_type:complete